MADLQDSQRWQDYYRTVGGRPPREFFFQARVRFPKPMPAPPPLAIDLGCGAGVETLELLKLGWRVLAIDRQPEALEQVLSRTPPELLANLTTQAGDFASLSLPPADFIWAGLSLPFCPPQHFPALWAQIAAALPPGGLFAGDFFGPEHAWAAKPQMTIHSFAQLHALFAGWQIDYTLTEQGRRSTALDGIIPWQMFSIIAIR
jgi:tellurite methyltransferase